MCEGPRGVPEEMAREISPPKEERKGPDPFKEVLRKLVDNPLATPESRALREEFERRAKEEIARFEKEFPDMEMVIGLAGSIQVGIAREGSDIDEVVFVRMKNGKLFREEKTPEEVEQIEAYCGRDQGRVFDFEELKERYGEYIIEKPEEADPSFNYWNRGPEEERQISFLISLRRRTYPKVFPLVDLFSYTTFEQEGSGVVDRWRKELLEVIARRPDREIFWDYVVRPAWRLQFVFVEMREEIEGIIGKKYAERVEKVIAEALAKRRKEREKGEPTEEEIEEAVYHLEGLRSKTYLPDLKMMLRLYEVEEAKP